MSKRQEVQSTEYYLRQAHAFISNAQVAAEHTGDKELHQEVTKLRQDVITIRKGIAKKLDSHQG